MNRYFCPSDVDRSASNVVNIQDCNIIIAAAMVVAAAATTTTAGNLILTLLMTYKNSPQDGLSEEEQLSVFHRCSLVNQYLTRLIPRQRGTPYVTDDVSVVNSSSSDG
jgi:hypothetical protein